MNLSSRGKWVSDQPPSSSYRLALGEVPATIDAHKPANSEDPTVKATELRPGQAVRFNNKLYIITKYDHTKPGKGPAYVQIKARDVTGSGYIEKRLNSSENVEGTSLDRRKGEFLYEDTDGFVFMDAVTFDQFTLSSELVGDSMKYLRPNAETSIMFHEDSAIMIELPASVELDVQETEPSIKGATATNQLKPAIMETGLKTRVPPFIAIGETLKISTEDGSYISRA